MIPLLLGAAAIWGINEVADAEENANKANRINREVSELVNEAKNTVNSAQENLMSVLEDLGENKRRTSIAVGMAGDFISDIKENLKRKNDTKSLRELEEAGIKEDVLSKMSELAQEIKSLGLEEDKQMDVSENENAVCVFGAMGAAALGFGAVAMPAMLIYGLMKSDEAKAAYYEAKERMDKARVYDERCKNIATLLNAFAIRGKQIDNLISRLNYYFVPSVEKLSNIIDNYGTEYRNYSIESKETLFVVFQLAQTVQYVVNTPMLQEDWSINPEVDGVLEIGEETVEVLADG